MRFSKTGINIICKQIRVNNVPFLLGEPGIGKSSFVKAVGEKLDVSGVHCIAMNQLADRADITGARPLKEMMETEEGKKEVWKMIFFPHEAIMDAILDARQNPDKLTILFLDEVNRTTSDILTAAMSFTTDRRIGTEYFPENIRFVLAGNDKGAVQAVDEAFISRTWIIAVEPDIDTFLNLPSLQNLNPFIKNVLQMHKSENILFGRKLSTVSQGVDDDNEDEDVKIIDILEDSDSFNQITTPRTIEMLSNFLNDCTDEDLMAYMNEASIDRDGNPSNYLRDTIIGQTGDTQFTNYLLNTIAQHLATVGATSNSANSVHVTKPKCYSAMKDCQDVQSLADYVANMTVSERSAALTYALYEKEANKIYIDTLAPTITKLEMEDMKTLMALALAHKLDTENVQTFSETNTAIAVALEQIISFNNG